MSQFSFSNVSAESVTHTVLPLPNLSSVVNKLFNYVIRSLRNEGYSQKDIDHLFKAIVLPKITYGLPVYGASASDLNAVQYFLKRCHKRRYISELYMTFLRKRTAHYLKK